MSEKLIAVIMVLMIIAIVISLNYLFVQLGEPRSLWLWCDMLKLCQGTVNE